MRFNNNISGIDALLNACCREWRNWSRYIGPAFHDKTLRLKMREYDTELHLRFDFTNQGSEVFVPVIYYSLTGDHVFAEPAWERNLEHDEVRLLTEERLLELVSAHTPDIQALPSVRATASFRLVSEEVSVDGWYSLMALLSAGKELPEIVSLLSKIDSVFPVEEQVLQWFRAYTGLLLPLIAKQAGTEYKERFDIAVRIDEAGMPVEAAYQGEAITTNPETWMHDTLSYFMPLVAAVGRYRLIAERIILRDLFAAIQTYAATTEGNVFRQLVSQRNITRQGILFEDRQYIITYPNPLQEYFLLESVLMPKPQEIIFSRYFPKEDITVAIRPVDLDKDMEMLYAWFHEEHAKPIWKMDWPMEQLELFYRTITAAETAHSFIGEINGIPTFNLEVYWVTRDVLGEYYEVLPDDYGTHLLISPTDKKKKFPSATMQTILDWLFAQPIIGRLVGEGSVDSMAALMNKVHVGFRLDRVLDMPHKRSHLNFCYREWYWARFPENKDINPSKHKTTQYEPAASL